MKLITFCVGLISVAQAAAAASTYSIIFTAAIATSFINIVNANISVGFCTGGKVSCYDVGRCNWSHYHNDDYDVPCTTLTEDECYETKECMYINQGKTNLALIACTTITTILLLVMMCVVCQRLPEKESDTEPIVRLW